MKPCNLPRESASGAIPATLKRFKIKIIFIYIYTLNKLIFSSKVWIDNDDLLSTSL
jgi:hypothetical protein